MKVLVVGGTRYLGREIVLRLAARGDEVTVVNRGLSAGEIPASVRRIKADIGEQGSLAAAIEDMTFDAAVHMIAMSQGSARAVVEPLVGRVGHYVQCGSVGVYAPLEYIPADENHPTHERLLGPNTYVGFAHKLAADEAARGVCQTASLPLTILRPTAIIGAGAVPIDIWGSRDSACFQRIIDGKVLSVPNDGRALIQYGHVGDLADAFVLALDQPEKPGIYNISSAYAITLNYYVEVLEEALGGKAQIEYVEMEELLQRHQDPQKLNEKGLRFLCEHMCFTIAKVRDALGYQPQVTAEQAVVDSVRWMLDEGFIGRR